MKLKVLGAWHEARRKNAALYDKLFKDTPVVRPFIQPGNWSVYNQYVVRLPGSDRDRIKQHLADKRIGTGVYYPIPLHRQECFAYLGYKEGDLPESERACREVLALPVYPELPEEQVRYVAKELLAALR